MTSPCFKTRMNGTIYIVLLHTLSNVYVAVVVVGIIGVGVTGCVVVVVVHCRSC